MISETVYRPTWAQINLEALAYNYRQVRNIVGPNAKILSVVKSDAYGHGLIEVSRKLVKCKTDYLGVASIDEAIKLRRSNICLPILVFGNILPAHIKAILDYNLTQTVCSKRIAHLLNRYAQKRKKEVNIHIKVDTGMGRLGIWHKQAFDFIKDIKRLSFINIEGLYSHLPSADIDRKFTNYQIHQFKGLIKKLTDSDINIPFYHIANSIGLINYKYSHFNMVRPGLMLYGIYPKDNIRSKLKLKPAMNFKSKIIYLKKVPQGRSISYGRTFITTKPTTIATIPVGYKDGYLRSLSNKSKVLIKGERCKVLGRICMDQMMVDVSKIKNLKNGDIVVLMGSYGKEFISAEEIAQFSGTIPYEIVCSIGGSVPRKYRDN